MNRNQPGVFGITSNGQVTIPRAIHEQDGQVMLEKADGQAEQRGQEALKRLRAHRPRPGLSTEAILALCRGEP